MQQGSLFEFTSFESTDNNTQFHFHYKTVDFKGKEYSFTETLQLPVKPTESVEINLLEQCLFNLHLILGISYYKLFLPKKIIIKSGTLTKEQTNFWNTVYTKGLGEFFYRNKIDFRELINFPHENKEVMIHDSRFIIHFTNRVLLGLGGGKDSLVAADLLKENSIETTAFIIETASQSKLVEQQIKALEIETIVVKRILDKQLIAGIPGAYQGHVPFSAITAFIGILTAILYDYRYVAVGNERSADEGNIEYLGEQINHQWSKTSEFEKLLREYLRKNISENLFYFSITRPFSELKIAELLSKRPQYFKLFSSCNRNFTISINQQNFAWCGTCPKCAFTFLLLAAFLDKEKIIDIVVNDLLHDSTLIELYKEMLGEKESKPFECVGTFDEVKAAFYLVHKRGEFEDSQIMKYFLSQVLSKIKDPEGLVKKELTPVDPKILPEEFKKIVSNLSS